MNLFRKNRPPPTNMIEVNDRLEELRYGNRLRQDHKNAQTINELVRTIDDLAAAAPAGSLGEALERRVLDARQFKVLDEITDIDLADPVCGHRPGSRSCRESSAPSAIFRRGHRPAS